MIKIEILKNINEIDDLEYSGYYWGSGAKEPQIFHGKFDPKLDDDSLFIQEAMLWNEDHKVSIMVNHTHRQIITRYDLSNPESDEKLETIEYTGHKSNGKKVKFYQYWKEESDPLCEGLPVLKMKAQIFCGWGVSVTKDN